MGSHQATLEEDVTLLNGQTSSSLTGRTSGLPQGQSDTPRKAGGLMSGAASKAVTR